METIQKLQPNKFGHWLKTSITARMLMVGLNIKVFLVPLSFIESLIQERWYCQLGVVNCSEDFR